MVDVAYTIGPVCVHVEAGRRELREHNSTSDFKTTATNGSGGTYRTATHTHTHTSF